MENKTIVTIKRIAFFLTLILVAFNISAQFKDITNYLVAEEGYVTRINADEHDWEYSLIKFPDSINGFETVAISISLDNFPIKDIIFPKHLKYLSGSFANTNIRSIVLPDNLYFLDENTFAGNPKCKNIVLPAPEKNDHQFVGWNDSIPAGSIVNHMVRYRAHFKYLKSQPYILTKDDVLFRNGEIKLCFYIGSEDIVIPSNIDGRKVNIAGGFNEVGLASVTISEGIRLKGDAFNNNRINRITFKGTCDRIPRFAFANNDLRVLQLPDDVTHIEEDAFKNNKITEVTLPKNLTYFGGFSRNSITNIKLPSTVDTIGNYALYKNQLVHITLPPDLVYIGRRAFSNNRLDEIIIPVSVVFIAKDAFSNNPFKVPLQLPSSRGKTKRFLCWQGSDGKMHKPGDVIIDTVEYRVVFK